MVMSTGAGRPTTGRRFSVAGFTFVLAVVAEVLAFIGVAHLIGIGWAFLLLIAVSAGGLLLLRREGPKAWREIRDYAGRTASPGAEITRNLTGVFAALLVAVPGFLTAIVGLALFLPPVRALASRSATGFAAKRVSPSMAGDLFGPRRVKVKVGRTTPDRPTAGDDAPIEGEIV
jgi:UPF0716 protein FxsA